MKLAAVFGRYNALKYLAGDNLKHLLRNPTGLNKYAVLSSGIFFGQIEVVKAMLTMFQIITKCLLVMI